MTPLTTLWAAATSRTTAITLLIAVSAVITLGATLPNPELLSTEEALRLLEERPLLHWLGERFNSMQLGRSPAFGIAGALLILSTALCTIDRAVKRLRSGGSRAADLAAMKPGPSLRGEDGADGEARVIDALRSGRWRWRIDETSSGRVISAWKGRTGFWGSIFFHGVLVTFLFGWIASATTAFYATFVITEGQERLLTPDALVQIERAPLGGPDLPRLIFRLDRFTEVFHDDVTAIDYTAQFTIRDLSSGKSEEALIKVNRPFESGGVKFILTKRGEAPRFILQRNGIVVFDSFVTLRVADYATDSVAVPEGEMEMTVRYFPDMARTPEGKVYSRSRKPLNPHFGIEVTRRGERLFRGLVKQGETAVFGAYALAFDELRSWVALDLVREPVLGLFFWSALIGLAGLVVRALDPELQVAAVLEGTGADRTWRWFYQARHFEALLQEQVEAIARAADAGGRRS